MRTVYDTLLNSEISLVIMMSVALSGCATSMENVDREIGANQPIAYKQGYADGSDSGYVAAGHPYYQFKKDVNRYSNDSLYKQGWDDGFAVKKGQYDAIGRSMH